MSASTTKIEIRSIHPLNWAEYQRQGSFGMVVPTEVHPDGMIFVDLSLYGLESSTPNEDGTYNLVLRPLDLDDEGRVIGQ